MKTIEIYTDGGSLGNPGPGGFGAVLIYGDKRKELSGGYRYTTNNRMEILAVIKALEAIKSKGNTEICVYTDSRLVYDAFEKKWIYGWEKKNWLKSDKKPVLNDDLWKQLLVLANKYNVKFHWIKAHSGIEENEICDALVKEAAMSNPTEPDTNYEIVSGYSAKNNMEKANEFNINRNKDFIEINDKYGNKIKIDEKEFNDFLLKLNLLME